MSEALLKKMARNIIADFLLTLGMTPSEGEDTMEIRDHGCHRVFTQQARVPDIVADTIDAEDIYNQLSLYLHHHNTLPTATRFYPYGAECYVCPCGCGTFLYVSIYHTA